MLLDSAFLLLVEEHLIRWLAQTAQNELTAHGGLARYSRIRKEWNGSPTPRKANISDSHFNVEPATPYVLSAEKTHRQNDTVTLFRHSRTSRSTETREQSTSPRKLGHAETVTPKLQERTVTEKQAPSQTWTSQQSKQAKQPKPKTQTPIPARARHKTLAMRIYVRLSCTFLSESDIATLNAISG